VSGPVEFVPEQPGKTDPPPEPPAPPPRRRIVARLAAAALVLGAVIAWAVTRPEEQPHRPAAAPPPTAQSGGPAVRPVLIRCQHRAPVATEVETAMVRYFPGIAIRNLQAFRCVRGHGASGRILFEAVSGHVPGPRGGINLDVELTLRTERGVDPAVSPHLGAAGGRYELLGQIKAISVNLDVTVAAYGRRVSSAPVGPMRRLCDFVSLNIVL
jgi:hypothetical protein